jgi:DNA repair protein RadA/Sms
MAKVKPPFFVRIVVHNAKWQGQCNSCKEWNTIAGNYPKEEKWLEKRISKSKAPKPLKSMK